MRELRLIHNDDGTQALSHARQATVRQDLEAWVDIVMSTPVDAFVMCVAFPDICYHETKVGERYGKRSNRKFNGSSDWVRARALDELAAQGTDILKVAVERVHRRNRIVLAGVRMSDGQHRTGRGYPDDPMFPTFAHEHPEFRIQDSEGKLDVCLDYTYQEVRDHRLAIIRELLFDYEVDGIELDFMQYCSHFTRPATSKQVRLMTMVLAEVRTMMEDAAEARGCTEPLILGVRMPPTLAECKPNGLAPATWAREGFIDYLVPSGFKYADMNIPLDDYLQVLRSTKCRVLYSVQPWTADPAATATLPYHKAFTVELPEFKAFAANAYAAGAHGLHMFNLGAELPGRVEEIQEALNAMAEKKEWRRGPRHYQFFPSEAGDTVTGTNTAQSLHFSGHRMGTAETYTFQFADGGRSIHLEGMLSWRIYNTCPADVWRFRVNGVMIPDSEIYLEYRPCGYPIRVGAEVPSHMYFQVDLNKLALRFRNQLEIIPESFEMAFDAERYMEVLEVWVFN